MWKHRIRSSKGSALIELALTLPLLALILVGAAELGRAAYFSIELSSAARAGAAYGSQNKKTAFASTSAALIETVAANEAPDITLTWSTPPTEACTCETVYASGASPTYSSSTPVDCGSAAITSCSISNATETQYAITYVQVAPQATLDTMFHYPGFPTSYTLSGYAQMRVPQN